ncbi:MAG: hypothetical protein KTR32_02260 [Granulosicoccus sp.]|nr:hypothetical protein [Granulosicoccus sp.]
MNHALLRLPSLLVCLLFVQAIHADVDVKITFSENIVQFTDGRITAKNVRSQFDCGERIHGVFQLGNLESGSRKIHTQWRSPNGRVESVNKREIRIQSAQQIIFLSSSIEFSAGDPLSSIFDPAAGFEPYIGKWSAEVLIDNQLVKSAEFQVLC